jgi:AAA family ATP:ADP antiporter
MRTSDEKMLKRIRFAGLVVIAFFCMSTYGMARPPVESLFLDAYSSKALPMVWFFVAVAMAISVAVYNRFVLKFDLLRLLGGVCLVSAAAFFALVVACAAKVPYAAYAMYVWKDVYVIILVEIFYSYANSVFPVQSARWAYGFFGVAAALGSVVGSMAVGPIALRFGTVNSIFSSVPIFIALWIFCIPFSRRAGIGIMGKEARKRMNLREACGVVRKSDYLFLLLILIFAVQIAVTLIDFEYNSVLERAYPAIDERTQMIGWIYAVINGLTLFLHALTGPVLRAFAVPSVLFSVPVILGLGLMWNAILPAFAAMAAVKILSKCFDFSIYKSAREMLYIPLDYEERTAGKSVVDMLSYRIAKGGASLVIMLFSGLGMLYVRGASFALLAIWLVVTFAIVARFRKKVSRDVELHGSTK